MRDREYGMGRSVWLGSVGGPAAIDGQDDAGEVAGLRVGEHQHGTGKFAWPGPAAERDLGGQEAQYLRIVVHASVERSAERAPGRAR